MRTREYDLNVYVVDGVARLSAYEYEYSDAPEPQPIGTNTAKFVTLEVPMDEAHRAEVAFLLDDPGWDSSPIEEWQDYDSPWENMAWVEDAPELVKAWADGLPEYEPETAHEWEENGTPLEYGERRLIHCLNCESTYEQYRLTWEELLGIR